MIPTHIRLVSDIHLEFVPFCDLPDLETDPTTVLVLAGDIGTGTNAVPWIEAQAARFGHVVYALGNHEFYRNNIDLLHDDLLEALEGIQNVTLLTANKPLVFENVRFIGDTLWTDFNYNNPLAHMAVDDGLVDFRVIRTNEGKFTTQRSYQLHRRQLTEIKGHLSIPFDGKTVVVTHHLPSNRSVHVRYVNSPINSGFASSLDHVICDYQPDLWLHGHTHDSCDYQIGETRVVCNPRGYPRSGELFENPGFDDSLVIEL